MIKMPDGDVVMGSAKHLLTRIDGVIPPMTLGDHNASLTQWQIGPHKRSGAVINVKVTAETENNEDEHDWLLMNLGSTDASLPCTPLVPRLKKAHVGETVYLLGVLHSDSDSPQNFYKCVVTSRPYKHYFHNEFSPPVPIAGFAGAPIVDSDGLMLGQALSKDTMDSRMEKRWNLVERMPPWRCGYISTNLICLLSTQHRHYRSNSQKVG